MKKAIYIMPAEEKTKLEIAKFFSKVYAYVAKISISIFITYLLARYLITIAYKERGYEAIGGEYIAIPMVFFVTYKFIGFIMKFVSVKVEKTWKKEK